MSTKICVYEGIRSLKVERQYDAAHPIIEKETVRQMTAEEIAKYGEPTMKIGKRTRGFNQLREAKRKRSNFLWNGGMFSDQDEAGRGQ